MNSMKNVLITGGAGFIGSHLCQRLLAKEDLKVVVIDNFSLGVESNISEFRDNENFTVYNEDLNNPKELAAIFRKHQFDTVFHLAANSDIGKSFEDPATDLLNTFQVTYNLLECMKQRNVKRLVFASTSAIYGEVDRAVNENHGPLFPISHYGAAKLSSEAFISSFSSSYNIQSYIFRFPNVVGDKATHGIIFDFLKKLDMNHEELVVLGNGEQEKPYLHVSDLINAMLYILDYSADRLNYYNISGSDKIKVKRIAEIVLEESKQVREIRYTGGDRGWVGDVPKFSYDQQKIMSTGWMPVYNSEQAIRKAVADILHSKKVTL
jgi:UDP-glucose 4-epimerase